MSGTAATGELGEYLNFGAGDPVPGWLNLDPSPLFLLPRLAHRALAALRLSPRSSQYLDGSYRYYRFVPGRSLPLADASLRAVYCSHVLEHLPAAVIPPLLAEFARVLRPGGVLRVIVPDLAAMAEQAFRDAGAFIPLDERLGTLPTAVAGSRLRAVLEGVMGFPSLHRTAISVPALATLAGPSWQLRPNLRYLDSAITRERLLQVEQPDRFETALAFELERR